MIPSMGKKGSELAWIGEIFFQFKVSASSTVIASSSQQKAGSGDSPFTVSIEPSRADWKGFPFRSWSVGDWVFWVLGEFSEARDLEETILAVAQGDQSPDRLNGHWLTYGWDRRQRRFHIWTNRFATLHGYRCTHEGGNGFGTNFGTIARLASARRLDWAGLTGFFGFGFFPEDRTYFDDIRILRPATHSTYDAEAGRFFEERYWNWRHEPNPTRSCT